MMLPPVDVAIIGAGMAGMSAAVHARLSGLSVRVFERHFLPGGLCTAWKRSGYVFDYCIDYFVGSRKGHGFYDIWKVLGVLDRTEFRPIDSFGRFVGVDGRLFNLYTDPKRLRDHMLALSPGDALKIKEFCHGIGMAGRMRMSEFSLSPGNLPRIAQSLGALPGMLKWSGISVGDWCRGLKDPLLREAIPALVCSAEIPLSGPLMMFGLMHGGFAAYPLGGSLPIAMAVESRAKSLGADFAYRSGVKRVLVEGGRAVGIELEDGRLQQARHVVAACDARATFDGLLEGRIEDPDYRSLFEERKIYPCIVQVSLGLKNDPAWGLGGLPKRLNLPVAHPIGLDGRELRRVGLYQYAHDPGMAPAGGVVLVVQFEADYDRWKSLRRDDGAYRAEKARLQAETIRALEEHFPGMAARVEVGDVATPTTCERYTGNWRGSTQGWLMTTTWMKRLTAGKNLPTTFAGVDRFHLIGQWTRPGGGLPPAAMSGRDVVRRLTGR